MTDLRPTIVPKSDQLNADDLIGQTLDVTITKVALCGEADQPIAVHFEGDNGKPYKPCKSMRRVMVSVWGPDGNVFIGRRLRLYRDDKVAFGGMAVGGIRISHMSDIDRDITMALTATRANRKPFTVRPLGGPPTPAPPAPDLTALKRSGNEAAERGSVALQAWWGALTPAEKKAAKASLEGDLKPIAVAVDAAAASDGDTDFGDLPAGLKTGAQVLAEQEAAQSDDQGGGVANNGPADGQPSQTLADRVNVVKVAMAKATDTGALDAIWRRAGPLRKELEQADPEGLLVDLADAFEAAGRGLEG